MLKHFHKKDSDKSTTIDDCTPNHANSVEVVLTGDDLVVEYVKRLCSSLRELAYSDLPERIVERVETFVNYRVWSKPLSLAPNAK